MHSTQLFVVNYAYIQYSLKKNKLYYTCVHLRAQRLKVLPLVNEMISMTGSTESKTLLTEERGRKDCTAAYLHVQQFTLFEDGNR